MTGRAFVDSNVLIYSVSDDTKRSAIADNILFGDDELIISTQVLSEFIEVTRRKKFLNPDGILKSVRSFVDSFTVVPIQASTVLAALRLQQRLMISYWDALIAAAALEAECSTLLTEDLQDGLIIEGTLRIRNPFL